MLNRRLLGSTLIATFAFTAPVFAQSQIDNNQPVQGSLHSREVDLQNKLNASYSAGIISSTELAEMQRDLDGILVKEDRQRTKAGGMNDSNFDSISKALDEFEGKCSRHSRKVAASASASGDTVIVPAGVPLTPITGNQSSIIQPSRPSVLVPTTTIVPTTTTSVTEVAAPTSTTTRTTTVRTDLTP